MFNYVIIIKIIKPLKTLKFNIFNVKDTIIACTLGNTMLNIKISSKHLNPKLYTIWGKIVF